jgi:hypothetical protein
VVALTLLIVGTSIAGLFIMLDYAYWMNWQFSYDDMVHAAVDGAFALGYMITSVYGFAIVMRFWRLQPGAWRTANMLAAGWLVLVVLALGLFGTETLSLVGLVVSGAILVGLNLTPIRREFGQRPLL